MAGMATRPMTKVRDTDTERASSDTWIHTIYTNVVHDAIYPLTDLRLRTTDGNADWQLDVKDADGTVLFTKTLRGHSDYHMTSAVALPAEHCTIEVTNNDSSVASYELVYTVMR